MLALALVSLGFSVYSAADMLGQSPVVPAAGQSVREPPPSSRVRRTFRLPVRFNHHCLDADLNLQDYSKPIHTAPQGKTGSLTVWYSDAYGRNQGEEVPSSV